MNSRKSAGAAPERRPSEAVEGFEKAMKALGKRDFEKAKTAFEALLTAYPAETEVRERAKAYLALCERQLEKRPAFRPKNVSDLLSQGVFLHNKGEFDEAMRLFRQAADQQPKNGDALYCLAAATARAGQSEAALHALRSAIEVSPAVRAQARSDSDFDGLRQEPAFQSLVSRTA